MAIFKKAAPKDTRKARYRASSGQVRLYTVSPTKVLLSRPYHQRLLKDIRRQVVAPHEFYDLLYANLMSDFVEFVQLLPEGREGHLGGLLNQGLLRAHEALKLSKQHKRVAEDALWTYVLFTSALLTDLGRLLSEQQVMICEPTGVFVEKWSPLAGSLVDSGSRYITRPILGEKGGLWQRATVLLARQLMPERAMDWIARDDDALASWLALLSGHEDEAMEDVGAILSVTRERIKQLIDGNKIPEEETIVDFGEPIDTKMADDFWKWLKKGISDKKISVNEADSNVHILDEGVFLELEAIYRDFLKTYSDYRDKVVLHQQFNYLAVAKWSGYDYKFEQTFSDYPGKKGQSALTSVASAFAKHGSAGSQPYIAKGSGTKTGIIVRDTKALFSGGTPKVNPYVKTAPPAGANQHPDSLLHSYKQGMLPPY